MVKPTFAEIVRERRKAKNLTQKELGKLVGLNRTTIFNIEDGQITTLKSAVLIANLLGFSLELIQTLDQGQT